MGYSHFSTPTTLHILNSALTAFLSKYFRKSNLAAQQLNKAALAVSTHQVQTFILFRYVILQDL